MLFLLHLFEFQVRLGKKLTQFFIFGVKLSFNYMKQF